MYGIRGLLAGHGVNRIAAAKTLVLSAFLRSHNLSMLQRLMLTQPIAWANGTSGLRLGLFRIWSRVGGAGSAVWGYRQLCSVCGLYRLTFEQ